MFLTWFDKITSHVFVCRLLNHIYKRYCNYFLAIVSSITINVFRVIVRIFSSWIVRATLLPNEVGTQDMALKFRFSYNRCSGAPLCCESKVCTKFRPKLPWIAAEGQDKSTNGLRQVGQGQWSVNTEMFTPLFRDFLKAFEATAAIKRGKITYTLLWQVAR